MTDNTTFVINKLISERIKTVLDGVANKFGINEKDLKEFLILDSDKQQKKILSKQCEQCMGRKQDGKQCTRKRKPNIEFCGKHENNRRYGRIDDDKTIIMTNNSRDIMRFVKKNINGLEYLIDDKNNVIDFSDIESPEFIGTLEDNQIVKCF